MPSYFLSFTYAIMKGMINMNEIEKMSREQDERIRMARALIEREERKLKRAKVVLIISSIVFGIGIGLMLLSQMMG